MNNQLQWIYPPFGSHTPFGFKKIASLFLLLSFLFFSGLANSSPTFSLTIIILSALIFVVLTILSLKNGVTIIRKTFISNKIRHEIRDRLSPLRADKSTRSVFGNELHGIAASLYLRQNPSWSYLDCLREILLKNKPKTRTAQVLGGGGAVIPIGLLEHFHITSDVIELSPLMIRIAKQFFLPLRAKSLDKQLASINFIKADAFQFVRKNQRKYGLTAVDLFVGSNLAKKIKDKGFIKKIALTSELVFVNFGINNTTNNLYQYFSAYINNFSHSQIYAYRGNYVGIFSNKRKIKGQIDSQRIF